VNSKLCTPQQKVTQAIWQVWLVAEVGGCGAWLPRSRAEAAAGAKHSFVVCTTTATSIAF
jgi:hypothetical protein